MLVTLLSSQHWAARSLTDALTVGKHHPKIELDHTIHCAADDQGSVAGFGVLAEAKGYGGLRLRGSSDRAGVAEYIAVYVEGYVNLLSGKNCHPSVR
jgi:hypothetical protein